MQIIDWQEFLDNDLQLKGKLSSMTVGIFDGVHRGHKALIERIVSHNINHVPAVVTFRQNHKIVNNKQKYIQSFEERLAAFESLKVQITIVIDFTESFRKMSGAEFLKLLFKHGSVGFFTVGNDFRCGYRLDTDAAAIKTFFAAHNIPVEIIPEVTEESQPISSSRIRTAIGTGNFSLAEKMLGRTLKQP